MAGADICARPKLKMKKRVTIKDIALASGYSVNCVSRALMDAPDISKKTKEKINELALEMGYIPNFAASTLRKGSSKTVGILYDNLLNPFYSIITSYLWNELGPCGYSFVMLINDKPFLDEDIAKRALSENIDGIISFLEPTEAGYELCKKHGTPLVILGRKSNLDVSCVVLDDIGGGRAAAEYMFNKGYRRPVYLGDLPSLVCSQDRAHGFIDRFRELGVDAEVIFDERPLDKYYQSILSELINRTEKPDCLFVFNDILALTVLTYLRQNNVSIAVVGFDDIQNEIAFNGRISSVGYDKRSFAKVAVDELLKLIADNNAKKEIKVLKDIYVVDGEN